MMGNRANILGVLVNSTSTSSVLNTIVTATSGGKKTKSLIVFTPNPEFIVEAQTDPKFKELLNNADINLPDGVGLVWAGRLLGQPGVKHISGADVVRELLEEGNKGWPASTSPRLRRGEVGKWVIGIAGARQGVIAESNELIKRLSKKYSNVTFVNLDSPNFQFPNSNPKFIIHNTKYNLVFAAHGMKKQEQWIWKNASFAEAMERKIKANVFMGVGGSLDFLTGFTRRAPSIIRQIGLEWLWRGLQKPGHWRRIWKAVVVFGGLVIKEKLNNFKL